jgi:energy-coupling factor transporter ATP-binding protein EcfA2
MATKLNNLYIKGIRGVKEDLAIPLNQKSILIYGDNGMGKSTISDSIEWFFKDEVSHLSGEEIDLKEALRNSYIPETEKSIVEVQFNTPTLNSQRILEVKKGKLVPEYSNKSNELTSYLKVASKENILLRHQLLTDFIDKTKSDKLKSLSEIIGFSEITKVKETLRKAYSGINTELKSQNFESQINTQKVTLKENLGSIISVEENLFNEITDLSKPLNTGIEVKSFSDIDLLLNKLKTQTSSPLINEQKFLDTCKNILTILKDECETIDKEYLKYYSEFNIIAKDVQSVMQIYFAELLKLGKQLIDKKFHKEDNCPLCLQTKKREVLVLEIENRLKEIEKASNIKISFDNAKKSFSAIIDSKVKKVEFLQNEALLKDESNKHIKENIELILLKLKDLQSAANEKVTSGNLLPELIKINLTEEDFNSLVSIEERINTLKDKIAKDNTTTIYSKVSFAKDAFSKIKNFEAEKEKLDKQKKSLEIIYNEFVKRQKTALEDFINKFSDKINSFYQFMNPDEQFDDLRIAILGDEDKLLGITVQYKFNGEWVSPPQKYFSESHLNCFGISFFLASVIAFNNESKFIVFDDVISSFDSTHRIRFANLLLSEFSEYQLIVLTHESNWFEYFRNAVKGKNWLVNSVLWNQTKGTHFSETSENLKNKIEKKIADSNTDKLGNDIREYLENILKNIAVNIEVKLKFLLNDRNEDRMAYELLTEVKGRVSKSTAFSLHNALFDRTIASTYIGNKDSHDSNFESKIGDLKAFWKDVSDIEALFFCNACKTSVHLKYFDESTKSIKCKCGNKIYDFKK